MKVITTITTSVVFEPVQGYENFVRLLLQGQKKFYEVLDIGQAWIQEHEFVGFPYISMISGFPCLFIKTINRSEYGDFDSFHSLSDCNIDGGGYNDHHVFTTMEEAEIYKAHVLSGGIKLSRNNKNDSIINRKGIKLGIFSETAANQVGSSWYLTPEGRIVEITCVCNLDFDFKNFYKWHDARQVCLVTSWSGHGRQGDSDGYKNYPYYYNSCPNYKKYDYKNY